MKPHRLILIVTVSALLLLGASLGTAWVLRPRPTTTITAGMSMTNAMIAMKQRGLAPQQMQIVEPHQAYNLPDGRSVVLVGELTVDAISVIANPATSKSSRIIASVPAITF